MVFVRHALSVGNTLSQDERSALEIPNHAYPLTDLGRQQAEITGQYLKETFGSEYFGYFFHSTFTRTSETMEVILKELGRTDIPVTDPRLDEKWDGIFHELSKAEIEWRYPDQIKLRKRAGYYHFRAPGGQNCPDVELQIRSFVTERLLVPNPKNMLIVGHGRWFLLFQRLIHNLSVEKFLEMKEHSECENASVTLYTIDTMTDDIPQSITPWKGKIEEVSSECA